MNTTILLLELIKAYSKNLCNVHITYKYTVLLFHVAHFITVCLEKEHCIMLCCIFSQSVRNILWIVCWCCCWHTILSYLITTGTPNSHKRNMWLGRCSLSDVIDPEHWKIPEKTTCCRHLRGWFDLEIKIPIKVVEWIINKQFQLIEHLFHQRTNNMFI